VIDHSLGEEPALRVVQCRVVLDLFLEVWLVGEDAAEDEAFVDARKDVVPAIDRVLHVLTFQSIDESAGSRLHYREVDFLLLVDKLDKGVYLLPVQHGVHVSEVVAEGNHDVFGADRVVGYLLAKIDELVDLPLFVVALEAGISDEGIVCALELVDSEHVRPAIGSSEYVREYLLVIALISCKWLPEESLRVIYFSAALWLIEHVVEELSFEAEVSEEGLGRGGVAVDANVPGDCGADAKFFLKELLADLNVQDEVLVVGAGLIRRYPATLGELHLTILNDFLDLLLLLRVQSRIPHLEVLDLNDRVAPRRVLGQLVEHSVEYSLHPRVREAFVLRAHVRLINRLLRAHLVPGVRHEMNGQMLVLILPGQPPQYFLRGRQIIVYLFNFVREIMMLLYLNLIKMSLDELPNGHPEALLSLICLRSLVGLAQLRLRQRHSRLIDTMVLLLLLLTIYNLFIVLLITSLINLLGGRGGRAGLQSLLILLLCHCLFNSLIR